MSHELFFYSTSDPDHFVFNFSGLKHRISIGVIHQVNQKT